MTDTPQDVAPQDATALEWARRDAPTGLLVGGDWFEDELKARWLERYQLGKVMMLPSSVEVQHFSPQQMLPAPDHSWLEMTCSCGCGYLPHRSWWTRLKQWWDRKDDE